jgi:hypothetical protein
LQVIDPGTNEPLTSDGSTTEQELGIFMAEKVGLWRTQIEGIESICRVWQKASQPAEVSTSRFDRMPLRPNFQA